MPPKGFLLTRSLPQELLLTRDLCGTEAASPSVGCPTLLGWGNHIAFVSPPATGCSLVLMGLSRKSPFMALGRLCKMIGNRRNAVGANAVKGGLHDLPHGVHTQKHSSRFTTFPTVGVTELFLSGQGQPLAFFKP